MRDFSEANEEWIGLRTVTFLAAVVPLFAVGACATGLLRVLGLDPSDLNRGIVWATCFISGCLVSCSVEFIKPLDPDVALSEHRRRNNRLIFLACLGGALLACLLLAVFFFIGEGKLDDFMIFGGLALLAIWLVWCVAVVVYRRYQFRYQLRVYSFFRSVDEENEVG
jgi:hypothetical protein